MCHIFWSRLMSAVSRYWRQGHPRAHIIELDGELGGAGVELDAGSPGRLDWSQTGPDDVVDGTECAIRTDCLYQVVAGIQDEVKLCCLRGQALASYSGGDAQPVDVLILVGIRVDDQIDSSRRAQLSGRPLPESTT